MRHVIAGLGGIAFILLVHHEVATSDSSTAALAWLVVPFVLAWWFCLVYLGARVWRSRSWPAAAAFVALVVLPAAYVAVAAAQGDRRPAPLVAPVDPGPGGAPVVNRDGLDEYLCPVLESGSYRVDRTIVYGVTCADARALLEHAIASAPDTRPVSFTSDGYAWRWSVSDYGDLSLDGRQPPESLTGRHVLAELVFV